MSVGFYAYNYFLGESGLAQPGSKSKLRLLQIPYYEIISTSYREDYFQLMDDIKAITMIDTSKITTEEFYPFFQFTDHSAIIYYNGDIVAKIYNYNKKCIPYIDVVAVNFSNLNNISTVPKSFIRLATFPTVLSYSIIAIMRARVQSNDDDKNLYYAVTAHLIEMRKYYFVKNKKTMLDNTIFKEFTAKCIGDTIPPDRQRKLIIEARKKKNLKLVFSYEPADGVKEPEINYIFSNTSGNKITNPKNLKLGLVKKEEDLEGDFDDENTVRDPVVEEPVMANSSPDEKI
jgi:hypothetical protein